MSEKEYTIYNSGNVCWKFLHADSRKQIQNAEEIRWLSNDGDWNRWIRNEGAPIWQGLIYQGRDAIKPKHEIAKLGGMWMVVGSASLRRHITEIDEVEGTIGGGGFLYTTLDFKTKGLKFHKDPSKPLEYWKSFELLSEKDFPEWD